VVPETGALDATRRFEMLNTEFKAEVDAMRKLREAAEKLNSEVLEAKDIINGVKMHFATLTRADAERIVNELQKPWAEGTSLTTHIISQARSQTSKRGEWRCPPA